jgi:hypothetical protein
LKRDRTALLQKLIYLLNNNKVLKNIKKADKMGLYGACPYSQKKCR